MTYADAIILGLVEGLTEFLPISSTGHLILTSKLLGMEQEVADSYCVIIQLGAILAVVVAYLQRFWGLLRPSAGPGFNGQRGILFLAATSLPVMIAGKLGGDTIKAYLYGPAGVAAALGVGGLAILWIERRARGPGRGLDAMTLSLALKIGLIQCLALWPGVSRSAATILGGIVLGLDRRSATEYSFFAAVPVLVAAAGYEILTRGDLLAGATWPPMLVGMATAFVTAWVAIRFLLRYVSTHTFTPFAWYRIALALAVWAFLAAEP